MWLIRQFHFVPRGNIGIASSSASLSHFTKTFPGEYDPAEIHNAGQLRRHMVWTKISYFSTGISLNWTLVAAQEMVVSYYSRWVCVCTWAGRWSASSCTSTACSMPWCKNRLLSVNYFESNQYSTSLDQVIIPMDDDVTVLNRPVETKYYSPPPDHIHSEVKLNQLVLIIHF